MYVSLTPPCTLSVWLRHNQTYLIFIKNPSQSPAWYRRLSALLHYYIGPGPSLSSADRHTNTDNVLQTTSVVIPATRRRKNSTTRFILYFLKWKFKSYKRGQTPCDLIMKHFPALRCVLGRICMFMVLICKREYSIRGLFAYTLHTHTHTHCVRTHLHVPLVWPHSQRWVSLVFSI